MRQLFQTICPYLIWVIKAISIGSAVIFITYVLLIIAIWDFHPRQIYAAREKYELIKTALFGNWPSKEEFQAAKTAKAYTCLWRSQGVVLICIPKPSNTSKKELKNVSGE